MPNVKILIDFEQCFNADGTINESLFNNLSKRGLLEDITLVVKNFPMDGRLHSLKNYIWNDYRSAFKQILSPQDIRLIDLDPKYQLGYAERTQVWADELHWSIDNDIKNCEIENISPCQTLAKHIQQQPSKLWQALGFALMALGAALIVLGALVATSTVGLASIPGAALVVASASASQVGIAVTVAGGASLIAGLACSFFRRKSGLAKELDNLSSALEKVNPTQELTDDTATVLLLKQA